VSDDIIDTIAEWLQASARYGCSSDRMAQDFLAALRGAGYEIVTTEEAKLISLENQPPSAPVAAEADQ
jgi:hypothetical protein